jgi:signal transduction histidine kinase
VVAAQLVLLVLITLAMALEGAGPASALRHLYLLPTAWATLRLGAAGGCLIGALAGLLQAPLVLPVIERIGLTSRTLDGLVSLVTPLALGWIAGRLVDQSRAHAVRLRALMEVQRSLAGDGALEQRLQAVAGRVRSALGASAVAVVVSDASGTRTVLSDPPGARLDERSAAGWSLLTGRAVSVHELQGDQRLEGARAGALAPVRGLVLPLDPGPGVVGVLAIERSGDLPAATRIAAQEMAMQLALGIENARLTLRQRRFADELAEKVAAATRRLRELDEAKTEFLSVVSHELRTPLTALQGFSELLLSRAVSAERARRCLGHLHSEARRLGRIVTDLLDLSRIESGRAPELCREAVELGEVVEHNIALFAAEHRRHRFEWSPDGEMPPVSADRDALDRMLKNLLSNAVKYSPGGGRVRITAGLAGDPPGMLELAVEDDGIGIPAEALPRIFDRYVRIPNPGTIGVRGLGLGLSLVRALAEAHGGSVDVESLPGKGSRFRLLLPMGRCGPGRSDLADFPASSLDTDAGGV